MHRSTYVTIPRRVFHVRWHVVIDLLSAVALAVALTAWAVLVWQNNAARVPQIGADVVTLLPCVSEDAAGPCYRDAARQGNGAGESFVVIDGVTYRMGR